MKTSKIIVSSLVISSMLLFATSCKKDFYANKNLNPNAPASVLPNVQLTPIEVSLAYTQGGDMARFSSMFDQQTTGVSRQCAAYYQYVFTNQDPETMWDNLYTAAMYNDYHLLQQCSTGTYNAYKGITEVLMAYSLQITVDCWGDIPYSQAFLGQSNLSPAYDKATAVYKSAMALCWQGIADLNNTTNDVLSPGSDDVMYNGNTAQWAMFAHAILARMYIHQSQTGAGSAAMADSAFVNAAAAFGSNADNAQVIFGTASTANAPWYQFYTQRGDISFTYNSDYSNVGNFFAMLENTNDPRKLYLVDSANESVGNLLNSYYQEATSPVEFICYDEMQFIQAEATLRMGGATATAQGFYLAGITADMAKVSSNPAVGPAISGGQVAGYETMNFVGGGPIGVLSPINDTALAQISMQKYIALYVNPEAWVEWRRSCKIPGEPSGVPALQPVAGPFQSNGIPRRFLYPQSELNLNASNVPNASQWSPKVFWDN